MRISYVVMRRAYIVLSGVIRLGGVKTPPYGSYSYVVMRIAYIASAIVVADYVGGYFILDSRT